MLRFNVRIGRIEDGAQARFADLFFRAFGRSVRFGELPTQPGFVAVILPEVRSNGWARQFARVVQVFNAMRGNDVQR